MNIGTNVQRLRIERCMSQSELAAAINVHQSHVSKIEQGDKKPSIEVLQALATFFGVTVDSLLSVEVETA